MPDGGTSWACLIHRSCRRSADGVVDKQDSASSYPPPRLAKPRHPSYPGGEFLALLPFNTSTSAGVSLRDLPTGNPASVTLPIAVRFSFTTECPTASNIFRIC